MFNDSELVMNQVKRNGKAQDVIIAKYLNKVQKLTYSFSQFNVL